MPGDGKFGKNKRHGGRVAGTKQFLSMKEEIQELKKRVLADFEQLRKNIGAYQIKAEIQVDCDHENICDITINIA